MAFLRLDDLTKRYGAVVAVDQLSLDIERGEFIALLGPSGCGKTTTLQMIAGLQEPSAGRIELDGEDITHKKPNQRGLGIVFQSYALFPHMTVFDNVSFGLEMRGLAAAERKERVGRVLDQVKLTALAGRFPKELSGGQRQRVALARALVIEPPLLLLDEPLSNLDAKLREEMQLELRLLQQKIGVTTILVTHDQSEALSMSDRVVVMNEGRAIQVDTPFGLYEAPSDAFVSGFVGKTNLFQGEVVAGPEGGQAVALGETVIAADSGGLAPGTPVQVSLRPEKIQISRGDNDSEAGHPAEITATVFHGGLWLYTLDSELGDLLVTEANSGAEPRRRGDRVILTWSPDAPRVLRREEAGS